MLNLIRPKKYLTIRGFDGGVYDRLAEIKSPNMSHGFGLDISKKPITASIDTFSIDEIGTISFSQLFWILHSGYENRDVRITVDLLRRAPKTTEEINYNTSKHLMRVYLYSKIEKINNQYKIYIDYDGLNMVLSSDNTITTKTLSYYSARVSIAIIPERYKKSSFKWVLGGNYYLTGLCSEYYNNGPFCMDLHYADWAINEDDGYSYKIHYAEGIYVAIRNGVKYSTSLDSGWVSNNSIKEYCGSPTYANGIWVTGTNGGGLWYSEDGKTWTQSNVTEGYFGRYPAVYGGGVWIASTIHDSGDYRGIWTSTDGKTWTRTYFENTYVRALPYYANGIWLIAVNEKGSGTWWSHGFALYSKDGRTWNKITSLDHTENTVFRYAHDLWVASSQSDYCDYMTSADGELFTDVWTSTDGINWTRTYSHYNPDSSQLYFNTSLVYGHNMWVGSSSCINSAGGIYTSKDGKDWDDYPKGYTSGSSLQGMVCANGVFIAGANGGNGNKGLAVSGNGRSWNTIFKDIYFSDIYYLASGEVMVERRRYLKRDAEYGETIVW